GTFSENTAADNPYSVSLATATASSTPSTSIIATTGPNDSSAYSRMSGVTPASTVGGKQGPEGSPPLSTRAPAARASSTRLVTRSTAARLIIGPIAVAGSRGSPIGSPDARSASLDASGSATAL